MRGWLKSVLKVTVLLRFWHVVVCGVVWAVMWPVVVSGEGIDFQKEIAALKVEVAKLRAESSDSWMTQRRAEEIKALIGEVLADADTRASLAGDRLAAGWDQNFFIASEDGAFLLKIVGQIQSRYVFTKIDGEDVGRDTSVDGFQQRRAKIGVKGHAYDGRVDYQVQGGFDRGSGLFVLDEGYGRLHFSGGRYLKFGQFTGRFIREEIVSSKTQVAVERSFSSKLFAMDKIQGIEVGAAEEVWMVSAALHSGRDGVGVDFHRDSTEIAMTGRLDVAVEGTVKQFKEFVGWSGSELGLMLGAGVDYEKMEAGGSRNDVVDEFLQWTADVNVQAYPYSFFVGVTGREVGLADGGGENPSQLSVVAQASMFIVTDKWDVFGRYEFLDFDGVGEVVFGSGGASFADAPASGRSDRVNVWTVGSNYYFHRHNSKVSLDVSLAPEGIIRGESGLGSLDQTDNEETQIIVRSQYQLLF